MPLLVTVHVFSGVPDPQWVISNDDEQELRQLIAAPAAASGRPAHEGVLGYSGFSVVDTAVPTTSSLFQVQSAGAEVRSNSIVGAPEVEDFLLWTGRDYLSDEVRSHIQAAIREPLPPLPPVPTVLRCPPCHAHDAPAYNPAFWNHPPIQGANNCYNYANDQATNTFAQPGRATGHMYTSLTCASVGAGAQSDGLKPCPNFTAPRAAGQGWYVALVI